MIIAARSLPTWLAIEIQILLDAKKLLSFFSRFSCLLDAFNVRNFPIHRHSEPIWKFLSLTADVRFARWIFRPIEVRRQRRSFLPFQTLIFSGKVNFSTFIIYYFLVCSIETRRKTSKLVWSRWDRPNSNHEMNAKFSSLFFLYFIRHFSSATHRFLSSFSCVLCACTIAWHSRVFATFGQIVLFHFLSWSPLKHRRNVLG